MTFLMLTSRTLVEILSQVNTGDFEDAMILCPSGKLLAYHGNNENSVDTLSVIASNMWVLYESNGLVGLKEDALQYIMFDYAGGKLAIVKVSEFIVCLRAKETVELGLMYAKAKLLADTLQAPLKRVVE